MYVILTSKTGEFRTEIGSGMQPVAVCDYLFYGTVRARFVIARLEQDVKLRLVDEAPPHLVNVVPTKFLQKFETVEQAMAELRHLTSFGHMDTRLEPRALDEAPA